MADNEIVKALECCKKRGWFPCGDCHKNRANGVGACIGLNPNVLWELIRRQKAEIERLTAMAEAAEEYLQPLPFKNAFDEEIEKAKSEAIREFAEKLKEKQRRVLDYDEAGYSCPIFVVEVESINNFVKEMKEQ